MKYYGTTNDPKDLITNEAGVAIANTQADSKITAAIGTGGAITDKFATKAELQAAIGDAIAASY